MTSFLGWVKRTWESVSDTTMLFWGTMSGLVQLVTLVSIGFVLFVFVGGMVRKIFRARHSGDSRAGPVVRRSVTVKPTGYEYLSEHANREVSIEAREIVTPNSQEREIIIRGSPEAVNEILSTGIPGFGSREDGQLGPKRQPPRQL